MLNSFVQEKWKEDKKKVQSSEIEIEMPKNSINLHPFNNVDS